MRCLRDVICFYGFVLGLACLTAGIDLEESSRAILGGAAKIENFPWLCSVACCKDKPTRAVSAATLITENLLASSTENLWNNISKPLKTQSERKAQQYFRMRQDLRVICGTSLYQPVVPANLDAVHGKNKQVRAVKNLLYIIDNQLIAHPSPDHVVKNPDLYDELKRNKFGNKFPIVFIEVERAFDITQNVQIAPTGVSNYDDFFLNMQQEMREREKTREQNFEISCLVAGWGISNFDPDLQTITRVVYQRVSYVNAESCQDAYCTSDREACFVFPPNTGDRFCAKSLHFGDMCDYDRGAAMYCPHFLQDQGGSVFGILSNTGPDCGMNNVPSVYMRIDQIKKWANFFTPGGLR